MTYYPHAESHPTTCDCFYCQGVDPNKSISRELEKCVEELVRTTQPILDEKQFNEIHSILNRLLKLKKYFPFQELSSNHFSD